MFDTLRTFTGRTQCPDPAAAAPVQARRTPVWVARQVTGLDAPVQFKDLKQDAADWKAIVETSDGVERETAEARLAEVKKFSRLPGSDIARLVGKSLAKGRAKSAEEAGNQTVAAAYRAILALPHELPEPTLPPEVRTVSADNTKTKHNMAKGVMAMALPGVGGKGALAVANTTRVTGSGHAKRQHRHAAVELAELQNQGYEVSNRVDLSKRTEWTLTLTPEAKAQYAEAHNQWAAATEQRILEICATIA